MIGTGIGLGLAGYRINPAGGPIPVLDINFRDYKTFNSAIGPTASFSRASTATYFDETGVLRTAAINEGRINHVYNGTSWVCKGGLIEDQRTNVVLQSSFQSGWTGNSATLTANSASCPDGTSSAMLLVPSSGGSFRAAYQFISGVNCVSVFAKASGKNHLGIVNAGGTAIAAWFNLSTGAVGTVVANYTATITSVGSGWYRCSLFSSLANYTIAQFCVTNANGSNSVTVNGSDGILLYGAQAESGSFSTSLIPTTTAATTRSADVMQLTGMDFSGIWNANEGTAVTEFDLIGRNESSGAYSIAWQVDDNTLNNRLVQIAYEYSGTPANAAGIYVASSGTAQANMYGSAIGINTLGKTAFAWKLNDFALSVNGAAVSTDTSGTVPTVSQLNIGRRLSDGYLNGHMARLRVWNQRLNDGTLRSLAT